MNFKKILFLFLALLLPVLIFIFLKSFGKNEFDVSPLFQDSIESAENCASYQYATPYIIPDSVLSKFSWQGNDSLALVIFDNSLSDIKKETSNQIARVLTEFSEEELRLIFRFEESDRGNNLQEGRVTVVKIIERQYSIFKNCIFLLKPIDNTVLADSKGRIRGQYNLTDMEEADRLIMEMKILLKKY